jgi:glucose/arabinose dehydrogenase
MRVRQQNNHLVVRIEGGGRGRVMNQRTARRVVAGAVVAVLTLAGPASAFLSTELVASGLNRPIYVAAPPGDARLFIVEQSGVIKLLKNGSVLATPFMDISSIVLTTSAYSEQGLLGLAFDPDFATNRRFYVHYTNLDGNTTIARYEVDSGNPDVADLSTAQIVFAQAQPYANHNGGSINFGPDGYLYFGLGDGGGAGDPGDRGQDPTTLLGKFICIDVSALPYTIPPTNPFVGKATVLDEIWAIGLRNPYRWSFDRSTGDMWIGDVGQASWEEIDFDPAGGAGGVNYGWSLMEGLHCYDPPVNCGSDTLQLPIYEYSHDAGECSITGGYVYRGAAIPELQGYYLFGDYCSTRLWALEYDGNEVTTVLDLTADLNPGGQIDELAGIGEDGDGELYLVDRDAAGSGEVYKVIPDPSGAGDDPAQGSSFRLGPAFPNPSTGRTEFVMTLTHPSRVTVRVYDTAGHPIRTLVSSVRAPGAHRVVWNGKDSSGHPVPSGVYFMKAESDGVIVTRKVNVLR